MTLQIDTAKQTLSWLQQGQVIQQYPIATALKGLGEQKNSGQTPRGWHQIRAKIGAGLPLHSVFVGRRPTGEIFSPQLALQFPDRDWILTRILWLSGLELGKNRLGLVDTMQRYIYIHGSPEQPTFKSHSSHGCIRMKNQDIFALFSQVQPGERVLIE